MIGYSLELRGEGEASEMLKELYARTTVPVGLHAAIATACADVMKGHLQARDGTHANKMGGRRSHFYWNAAQTVKGEATAEGAEVSVNYLGLRQRWLGGDIYPINAKYLAIPARSESYGIPPKEFPGDLTCIRFRSGTLALVKDEVSQGTDDAGNFQQKSAERGQRKSRKRTIGLVEYWLKDHVYQEPDPTVMPSPQDMLNAATEAASEYLTNQ